MAKNEYNLEADDFVKAVIEDVNKPHGTHCVSGYIGKSSQDDCIRIYLDVNLTSCFDLKKDAIVHVERVPKTVNSLGGAYIWYKPLITQTNAGSFNAGQENQFFQGTINRQFQQAQQQHMQQQTPQYQTPQYQTFPPFCAPQAGLQQ